MQNTIYKVNPTTISMFKKYYLDRIMNWANRSNTIVNKYIKQRELEDILRFINAYTEIKCTNIKNH